MKKTLWNSSRAAHLGLLGLTALFGGCRTTTNNVLTYHNDNARSGLNTNEKELTWANVKSGFKKLSNLERSVDGCVYAQPLFKADCCIAKDGNRHNVVFVATAKDLVYAFDADSSTGANATALWTADLTMMGQPVLDSDVREDQEDTDCVDITPTIGITGTPVIDGSTSVLYVVAKTREIKSVSPTAQVVDFVQRLHALDLASGSEMFGGPVEIARTTYSVPLGVTPPTSGPATEPGTYVRGPTVAGTGEGQGPMAGQVFLNALRENQRAGLTLVKGVVYVTWTSHCDCTPAHGWVVGFDAKTLHVVSVFNTTPNATSVLGTIPNKTVHPPSQLADGGIWQAGAAPAADDSDGSFYFATANGIFEHTPDTSSFPSSWDFGDSVLKLVPDGTTATTPANPNKNGWGQKVADFFTPYDEYPLENGDIDLGSGGVLLLPDQPGAHPHLAVQAGKNGTIYLLDRDSLGKFNLHDDSQIVQSLSVQFGTRPSNPNNPNTYPTWTNYGAVGLPAYFNQALYFIGQTHNVFKYPLVDGKLQTPPLSVPNALKYNSGATPSISANQGQNGIVWALWTDGYRAKSTTQKPISLHAYRADTLESLYDSDANIVANVHVDRPNGYAIEYTVPTVAGGRVFVGTSSGLAVYGIPFSRWQVVLWPFNRLVQAFRPACFPVLQLPPRTPIGRQPRAVPPTPPGLPRAGVHE